MLSVCDDSLSVLASVVLSALLLLEALVLVPVIVLVLEMLRTAAVASRKAANLLTNGCLELHNKRRQHEMC
jgi:hypothetical protein